MTKKTATIKAPVIANSEIANLYANLSISSGKESIKFIQAVAELQRTGKATVRSTVLAIESSKFSHPLIKKSHSQFFIPADLIIKVATRGKTVADILKMAERAVREHGATKSLEIIESAKSWEELEQKCPTQTKSRTNAKASAKVVPLTVELIVKGSLDALRKIGGKNLRDVKTSDLDTMRALLQVLVTMSKNSQPIAKVELIKA